MNPELLRSALAFGFGGVGYLGTLIADASGVNTDFFAGGEKITLIAVLTYAVVKLWRGMEELQREVRTTLKEQLDKQDKNIEAANESRNRHTAAINAVLDELKENRKS